MGNRKVQRHVELDVYRNHKHVLLGLQDLKNILSKKKRILKTKTLSNKISRHTATVAAISAPTPPVIGAS
jgi:hypothetical protein